ncbi:MAG TPA: bifunctional helix-turn-helix transcriptional regulator/GNAT family N-acetyltransferase [Steroidobacteraceae bacterium]|jgi:DNA-binding MarR family transcriptional regulator/GNAT superfamily N-acetyltransferase|nr:bifunctional helix-turn-helix transcriptional regulator/GNAT family N-acetyltransferase [Steroidobacteraceae bacterium]
MTSLHDYGSLLLGSRLRKVSEALYAGVDEVYRSAGVELPSRCFPILFLLRDHGSLGISELAQKLGQTHPAVSQMSRKLLRHRLVTESPDPGDDRRRLLALSPRARSVMTRLEPVWKAIVAAVADLEAEHPLSQHLTAVDRALEARGFAARIRSRLEEPDALQIIPFERRYAADFKRLNIEWLQKYFRVEPIDEEVLSRPARILRDGGAIFLARHRGAIVGTCALLSAGDARFELAKMAVTAGHQGLGIGRKLIEAVIAEYRAREARELFLESNSRLTPAITLYESAGFVHAPRPAPSHYERSDVYMVYVGGAR